MSREAVRSIGMPMLGVALVLMGCGDLTSGGIGEVEVVMAADSVPVNGLALSPPAQMAGVVWGEQVPPDSPRIEGTLTIRVQVFVFRAPGRWIEVTEGPQDVVLPLGEPQTATIARKSLPAGPYRAARTLFRRVEANIRSGLVVDGEPITGRILVDLGLQDRIQIDTDIGLDVVERGVSELVVDLHAERWLRRLNAELRQVSGDHFTDEFRLRHHR